MIGNDGIQTIWLFIDRFTDWLIAIDDMLDRK